MFRALGAAGALLVVATATPAKAAEVIAFSFAAPLTNGDVASGSGTLTTASKDALGRYYVLGASGSFKAYASEKTPRLIAAAMIGFPLFGDAYLYEDAGGALVTDGITFFNEMPFDGITLGFRQGSSYGGFFSEVGVTGATLSFTPQLAGGVPEPTTWALMILGFGAIGAALRRRGRVRTTVRYARA